MSIKPCIFVTYTGKEPPKDFLEAVVRKYPTAASAVLIGATEMKRCTPKPIIEYSAEDFAGLVKANPEDRIAFWLCNTSDTMNEEDFQPYPLLVDGEGTVHMYAYAEGDFTGYVKPEMNISPETHAINEWLIPKVKSLCVQHDDALDKVMDHLQGEEGKKELEAEFFSGKRGALILMTVNRVEAFFHKNAEGRTEDWGYTSDACVPVEQKKSKFGGGGASQTPAPPAAEPAKVPSVTPIPNSTEEPKGRWVAAHSIVQGNIASKEWYYEVTGMDKGSPIPTDILNAVLMKEPIFIPELRWEAIRARPIAKKMALKQKPAAKDRTKSDATPDTKPQGTKTDTKHIPSGGSAVPQPLMSEATKSKMADLFLKPGLGKTLMDNRTKEGPTVEQLQNLMEKTKDFHSQLADKVRYDVEWSLTWPYEMHLDIGRTDYQGLAVLSWYNGSQLLLAKSKILELEAKLTKALGNKGLLENKPQETLKLPEKKSKFAA